MKRPNYLTPNEEKFELWLKENMPYLLKLWNFTDIRYEKDKVDSFLESCSESEALMLNFAMQVWTGGGQEEHVFNLFKALRTLDNKEIKIIQKWISDPWCC